MKSTKISSRKKTEITSAILFLLPNAAGFLVFSFAPIIAAFALSFTNWDGFNPNVNFIAFENYIELFQHDTFLIALKNTFVYTIGFVPLTLVVALLIAVALNCKLRAIKVYRAIYFMPYITATAVIAYVWSALLHPTMGPINQFLMQIGIENPPAWLTDSQWAMFSVIIMSVWKNFGYYTVIFLAALQGVPYSLTEAAMVDGANSVKRFFSITIPMITPAAFFAIIMAIIESFKVFDQVMVLTAGGPGRATTTLVQYIYTNSFTNYRMGYASAAAVVLFVIIFVITMVQYRGQNKWVNY